mmetsp:Transcript_21678/g.43827  ORF Transcript_21678/g.43827 Transcript_21678/m.43827 type:complete len:139 (+) Transcript_21678:605-1021(+)
MVLYGFQVLKFYSPQLKETSIVDDSDEIMSTLLHLRYGRVDVAVACNIQKKHHNIRQGEWVTLSVILLSHTAVERDSRMFLCQMSAGRSSQTGGSSGYDYGPIGMDFVLASQNMVLESGKNSYDSEKDRESSQPRCLW